jgi:hypothetical protein
VDFAELHADGLIWYIVNGFHQGCFGFLCYQPHFAEVFAIMRRRQCPSFTLMNCDETTTLSEINLTPSGSSIVQSSAASRSLTPDAVFIPKFLGKDLHQQKNVSCRQHVWSSKLNCDCSLLIVSFPMRPATNLYVGSNLLTGGLHV